MGRRSPRRRSARRAADKGQLSRRLVLDSAAVTALAERSRSNLARVAALRDQGLWPPVVPSVVMVECLVGHAGHDAAANRFLKTCDIVEHLPTLIARRAARLRALAKRGSAVDAVVVVTAEPSGIVSGSDLADLRALAAHAEGVTVRRC